MDEPTFKVSETLLKLRRRQTIRLDEVPATTLFSIKSGVVLVTANPSGPRRVVISILYAGDLFTPQMVPPHTNATLTAATEAEVLRVRPGQSDHSFLLQQAGAASLDEAIAGQIARQSTHICLIGTLSGSARVASCLLELAMRTGKRVGAGVSFELPLTRSDMADYLSLNADTLSRIMSHFRAERIIVPAGRNHFVTRDLDLLRNETAFAAAISALHDTGATNS